MSMLAQHLTGEGVNSSRLLRAGAIAAIGAAAANLIVYFIGSALVPDLSSFPLVNPVTVVLSSVIGAVAAIIVFGLIARFTQRPATIFRIVAVVATLLSLGGPISAGQGMEAPPMPGIEPGAFLVASAGTVALMIVMHIIAAVIITWTLTTQAREG